MIGWPPAWVGNAGGIDDGRELRIASARYFGASIAGNAGGLEGGVAAQSARASANARSKPACCPLREGTTIKPLPPPSEVHWKRHSWVIDAAPIFHSVGSARTAASDAASASRCLANAPPSALKKRARFARN